MLADLRFALRLFARSPLFSLAVVLVLGLGVGASTTVFTLVDTYLLKPLPFHEPERLVSVWRARRGTRNTGPFAQPDFLDLKEQSRSFSHLAIVGAGAFSLTGGEGARGRDISAEFVIGSRASAEIFPALGVGAAIGRVFTADEDAPGRNQVVVLSDALWRRRFGADPSALGRTVSLDGKPYQIIGVLPAGLRLPSHLTTAEPADLWVPAALTRESAAPRDNQSTSLGHVIGRLAPGVSLEAADNEVQGIAARLEQANPDTNTNRTFHLLGLQDQLVAEVRPSLTLLFAATLLLLVIASANVALLLLARAAAREGEAAVRAALGASRSRLVRQFLAESLLLSLSGGLLGFGLARLGVGLVASGYASSAPALREVRPDARVFAFSLLLASLTGLGFGLVPALRASKTRLYELLKEGAARSTEGGRRQRLQGALLVAEVALSAVLLAGSTAVARGFYKTLSAPIGFKPEGVLTFGLRLPDSRYADAGAVRAFHQTAFERLRALPSVSSAGVASYLPLTGRLSMDSFQIEGKPPWPRGEAPPTLYQFVGGDYFTAMGVPLLRGRALTDADAAAGAHVTVVSEGFAARFLPGEDPVGRRVRYDKDDHWFEIVGVAGDVRFLPWPAELMPATYVPQSQSIASGSLRSVSFVVRSKGDPGALANAAREAIRAIDADLPITAPSPYEKRVGESVTDRRFTLWLVSGFAVSALILTALGLFGLVSYQTRRRSRELAIRMALGAASADVQRLVLRDTSRLLIAGLALGLPAAFAAGRLLASKLEGVPPTDPLSLAATALLLGLVALAAVLTPARRAARTPPALVLRDD